MLDTDGYVAEASGENIFIVSDGVLRTPPLYLGAPRDHPRQHPHPGPGPGRAGSGRPFSRDDLYLADEAFLTGTAAEVTPIREVDGRVIGPGKPAPSP